MRWVIGDIHGMLTALDVLMTVVRKHDPDAHFICCGDYVNRGPDSRGVVDLLMTADDVTCIRGNHDDLFQLFLTGKMWGPEPTFPDPVATLSGFVPFGVMPTWTSYGVPRVVAAHVLQTPTLDGLAKLTEFVPQAHVDFFRTLPGCYVDDDMFVVHAYWSPRSSPPTAEDRLQRMLWQRFDLAELGKKKNWGGSVGYFGHTPILSYDLADNLPLRGKDIVLLDTGCCLDDGRLSAVCHETGDVVQVHRTGELIDA
ncbi:MAG: metallophosphoesterase [Planctomycetota bacterium]